MSEARRKGAETNRSKGSKPPNSTEDQQSALFKQVSARIRLKIDLGKSRMGSSKDNHAACNRVEPY